MILEFKIEKIVKGLSKRNIDGNNNWVAYMDEDKRKVIVEICEDEE